MDATETLIACPTCDALWREVVPVPGERARCGRCHTVLITPRLGSEARVIALALANFILITAALSFPFLSISAAGLHNSASLASAAFAFARERGPYELLAVLVLAGIVLIPLLRVLLIVYVLAPLAAGREPFPHARGAFLWAERLVPWSMAEIFAIGCAVALVKVADLAHIGFGPAFWLFGLVTVVAVLQDQLICRWSVWESLDNARVRP